MLWDELKSVLNFSAFKAEADDASVPWNKRFKGRRTLLLNVGRSQTSWRGVNKNGIFSEGGFAEGEFSDIAPQRADEWRALADGGWCVVSINNRFIMTLEANMMRENNCTSLLRTNPRAVLGPKYDRGKRYGICHHPDTSLSMLLACEESLVKITEDELKNIGLRAGRVCCGLFALTEHAIHQMYVTKRLNTAVNFALITACEGSMAILIQQHGQWKELRSRSGMGQDAVETSLQIITPLLQKLPQGSPIYFISDGQDARYCTEVMAAIEKMGGQDLTEKDILWKLIGSN